jgi:hypothetical protein
MCSCDEFGALPQSDAYCIICSNPFTECDCEEIPEEEESKEKRKKKTKKSVYINHRPKSRKAKKMNVQSMDIVNYVNPSYVSSMYTDSMSWFHNDRTYDVNTYVSTLPYVTQVYLWLWIKFYNCITYFYFVDAFTRFLWGPDWFMYYAIGVNKSFLARHILSYGFYKTTHDLRVPKQLLKFTLALAASVLIYKAIRNFFSTFEEDIQGSTLSIGKTPPPDDDGKPTVSYENPFHQC